MKKTILAAIISLGLCAASSAAEQVMTYQGRLKQNGQPANQAHSFAFSFCDKDKTICTPSPSGTASFPVNNGLFKSTFTVPAGLDLVNKQLFLRIELDNAELSPMEPLTYVPYAVYAASANYVNGAVLKTGDTMGGPLDITILAGGTGLSVTGNGASISLTAGTSESGITSNAQDKSIWLGPANMHVVTVSKNGLYFDDAGRTISSETAVSLGAGLRVSTNVYIVGFSSAAKYYGDGSDLTGITATGFSGVLSVNHGGTGLADAGGTANRVLRTADGSSWTAGQVDLANDVTGALGEDKVSGLTTALLNIRASTGVIAGTLDSVIASTGAIQAGLTGVIASTGAIQTSLNGVITSTGTMQAVLNGVILSTGALDNRLYEVAADTKSLNDVKADISAVVFSTGHAMTGGLVMAGGSTITVTGASFSVGGSTLTVANGLVGVGTAQPDQKFTVAGNISQTGVIISSGTQSNYFAGRVGIGLVGAQARLAVAQGGDEPYVLTVTSADAKGIIMASADGGVALGAATAVPLLDNKPRLMVHGLHDTDNDGLDTDEVVQVWTDYAGVVVSSMMADGRIYADASGLRNIPVNGDNLGDHTATKDLDLNSHSISGATNVSVKALGISGPVEAINISSNVYIVGYSSAARYYGDGSQLKNIVADGAVLRAGDSMTGSLTLSGSSVTINADTAAQGYALITNGVYISTAGSIITAGTGNGSIAGSARGIGAVDLQTYRGGTAQVASGAYSVISGGITNTAGGVYSVISGGGGNSAGNNYAAVSGGNNNNASAQFSAVSGGMSNNASGANAVVSGGNNNTASGNASAVGGGSYNAAGGSYAAIAGGINNSAAAWGAVPGGSQNSAAGQYSFAAGYVSSSTANGAFTWTDSAGVKLINPVNDRTVFKSRGGFLVTGSTNTSISGTVDRGVFMADGRLGVSTGAPQAALDVVAAGATLNESAQIWRNSGGAVVASMTATGFAYANGGAIGGQLNDSAAFTVKGSEALRYSLLVSTSANTYGLVVTTAGRVGIGTANEPAYALQISAPAGTSDQMLVISTGASTIFGVKGNGEVYTSGKFIGDGSGLKNLTGDDLGSHTATKDLSMNGFAITGVSSITTGGSISISPAHSGNEPYGVSIGSISFNNYSYGVGVGYNTNNNYLGGVGVGENAYGNYTYGIGIGNDSANNYGMGVGIGNNASGNNTGGVGIGSGAGSNGSHGVGIGDSASGNNNYGVGIGAQAKGNIQYAVGIGAYSQNNGNYASAVGAYSYAASSSAAFGYYAKANAANSLAFGAGTVNDASYTAGFGSYAVVTSSRVSAARYDVAGEPVLAVLPGEGSLGIGIEAGRSNTGNYNLFVGSAAGKANTTGSDNTYIGFWAGINSIGGSNTFVGASAGKSNKTGSNNTIIGDTAALDIETGKNNTYMGFQAAHGNSSGSGNAVIGANAGLGAGAVFSSSTIMGYQAGNALTSGSNNVLLGYQAGDTLTTGSGNIIIGYDQDVPASGTSGALNIGGVLYGDLYAGTIGISTRVPQAALDVVAPETASLVFRAGTPNNMNILSVSTAGAVAVSGSLAARVWQKIYTETIATARAQINLTGLNSFKDKEYKLVLRHVLNATGSCPNKELGLAVGNASSSAYDFIDHVSTASTAAGQYVEFATGYSVMRIGYTGQSSGDTTFVDGTLLMSNSASFPESYMGKSYLKNSAAVRRMDEIAGTVAADGNAAVTLDIKVIGATSDTCFNAGTYVELWALRE